MDFDMAKVKTAKEMYLEGEQVTEIARKLNTYTSTIYYWRKKFDWDNERSSGGYNDTIEEYAIECCHLQNGRCKILKKTFCKKGTKNARCSWFETADGFYARRAAAIRKGALENISDYAEAKRSDEQ